MNENDVESIYQTCNVFGGLNIEVSGRIDLAKIGLTPIYNDIIYLARLIDIRSVHNRVIHAGCDILKNPKLRPHPISARVLLN